jgi:hypothetical protein
LLDQISGQKNWGQKDVSFLPSFSFHFSAHFFGKTSFKQEAAVSADVQPGSNDRSRFLAFPDRVA